MTLTPLSLSMMFSVAYAQDDDEDESEEETSAYGEKEDGDIPSERFFSGPWEKEPFVDPIVGVTILATSSNVYPSIGLGAQGGFRYWQSRAKQPVLMGTARLRGEYLLGSGLSGPEVRLGNFIGPWFHIVGLQTGPDLFWNKYSFTGISLDPTVGLAWPVLAVLDLKLVRFNTGVQPGWYFTGDLPEVDWSEESGFGFGHEYTWFLGGAIDLKAVGFTVSYTHRTTGYGVQQGIGAGIRLGG